MKEILIELSKKTIELEDNSFNAEQKETNWIGNLEGTEESINNAQARLKIKLPTDYVEFIKISNGFPWTSSIAPTFSNIDSIKYLRDQEPELVEIWSTFPDKDMREKLARSIIIAGINEEQYFLLIPPINSEDDWEYWKFANWIPGEEEYKNLKDYFLSDIKTITSFIEDKKTNH